MAEVLLLHHAQGLTPGVEHVADTLRRAGHTVHVPDLYDGRTFDDLEAGIAYAAEIGFDTVVERGRRSVDGLPDALVYVGFSLGVMPAQLLAQTRPGALGAVLAHACVPPEDIAGPWPAGLPAQVHGMDADPVFVDEGDLDAARALADTVPGVELYLYPGDQHLFTDDSLPSYRGDAAELFTTRVLAFLDRVGPIAA